MGIISAKGQFLPASSIPHQSCKEIPACARVRKSADIHSCVKRPVLSVHHDPERKKAHLRQWQARVYTHTSTHRHTYASDCSVVNPQALEECVLCYKRSNCTGKIDKRPLCNSNRKYCLWRKIMPKVKVWSVTVIKRPGITQSSASLKLLRRSNMCNI